MTMICASGQPYSAAFSTKPYWRSVLSLFSNTCLRVDWRTYTIAWRARWSSVILGCIAFLRDRGLAGPRLDVVQCGLGQEPSDLLASGKREGLPVRNRLALGQEERHGCASSLRLDVPGGQLPV